MPGLVGGLRASAQMISYELAMGLSLVGVLLVSGTLRPTEIVAHQAGGIWTWNIFSGGQLVGFVIFVIAGFAETNRLPFDMPVGESAPVANHELIRRELHAFSPELASKPEVVVLNKIDLVDPDERDALVRRTAHAIGLGVDELVVASGATGENLREVLERAWELVRSVD